MCAMVTQAFGSITLIPPEPALLSPIDPFKNPKAFSEMVCILYHAERAALEAFGRLTDESIVENCEVFLEARPMLLADEEAHLRDMEQIIRLVGGGAIGPAPAGFAELWDLERTRQRLPFPLPAEVAALFTLIAESVGYAYLYHMAKATSNPEVAKLLWANVEDEQRHLQVSMQVLATALAKRTALVELGMHFYAFMVLSRNAARTMMASLSAIGLQPYLLASSSLQFTTELIGLVLAKRFGAVFNLQMFRRAMRIAFSPHMIRLYHAATYVPEPPFIWPVFRRCVGLIRKNKSTKRGD